MKNYLGFVLLAGFVVTTSAWQHLDEQRRQDASIFRARQILTESFVKLDLENILAQNAEYLERLDAGYDSDNKRFFIEQPIIGSIYDDAGILILISYPRPDEAEICIYAPEHLAWQWLRSRVRRYGSCINAPMLFEPMLQPDDLLLYSLPEQNCPYTKKL
ncbi:MAG: hypothetical protein CVV42_10280 [Candidatus Riflebacteria bacterium HGW-Riflebacteria-2]|nr:MAG: hypothetical protein CVV42_10280 [Candidatus Riflebacteria bacterium HGW-Riflebacteria-2]